MTLRELRYLVALAVCGYAAGPPEKQGAGFRATSLETIRQMVAAGLGCTLLPSMALDDGRHPDLAVRPLAAEASRPIGLVWRKSYPGAADLEFLGNVVRSNLPDSVAVA